MCTYMCIYIYIYIHTYIYIYILTARAPRPRWLPGFQRGSGQVGTAYATTRSCRAFVFSTPGTHVS